MLMLIVRDCPDFLQGGGFYLASRMGKRIMNIIAKNGVQMCTPFYILNV